MKPRTLPRIQVIVTVLLTLVSAVPLSAVQLVPDGETLNFNGSTNIGPGDLDIGLNTGNTLLNAYGGAKITNSFGTTRIGVNVASSNNVVIVQDAGSVLHSYFAGFHLVGVAGAANELRIRNGGQAGGNFTIGQQVSSSSNIVEVSGNGSRGGVFYVGESSSWNSLLVSNGGWVTGVSGSSIGYNSSSMNNVAIVTGAGTVWTNPGAFYIGRNGAINQLIVSEGGFVASVQGFLGSSSSSSSNNSVIVTGSGSSWTNHSDLEFGGTGNQLVISNGASVFNNNGTLRGSPGASHNIALITGGGSVWSNRSDLYLGATFGQLNQLVVNNGARVHSANGYVGGDGSSSNLAVIADVGSVWNNRSNLYVGGSSASSGWHTLIITNGGYVSSKNGYVGNGSGNLNLVVVTGNGSVWTNSDTLDLKARLVVTNGGLVSAATNIRMGSIVGGPAISCDGGNLFAGESLTVSGGGGTLTFNSGTLSTRNMTNLNSQTFVVGDGSGAATYNFLGGIHSVPTGTTVRSNAWFRGNGTVVGRLTVQSGGSVAPGTSIGKLVLNTPPVLQGQTVMEISKSGSTLTNDQLQVSGTLTNGGILNVTKLGANSLTGGDRFQLFSASGHAGSFSSISLPSLLSGLSWTNKLLIDGSIEVIGVAIPPRIDSVLLLGTSVIVSGTNGLANANYTVLTATNLTLPVTSWLTTATNQFLPNGSFIFTNQVATGEPARFFRLQVQ